MESAPTSSLLGTVNPPKTIIKLIILTLTVICLLLVWTVQIPSFVIYRTYLTIILGLVIVFHTIFWFALFDILHKKIGEGFDKWAVFVAFCGYILLFAAASFYSDVILIPLLFIATLIVFDNWQLIFFASFQLLLVNLLVALGFVSGQIGQEWANNITLLNLVIGLVATVASFQMKERELKLQHLEEMTKIKNTYIAAISHNLRTPITAINGYIQLLTSDGVNFTNDQKTILSNIKTNADNLGLLIEDTINVSAIESGQFKLRLSSFSLKPLIAEVLTVGFKAVAQSRGSEIVGPTDKEPDILIEADKERLKVVISNLVDNALKYTDRGRIKIGLDQTTEGAIIKVSDTGRGIAPEFQKELFEEFSRPNGIINFQQKGTGLGLYIARLIVESHHGKIWVDSEVNLGTTFYILIPFKQKIEGASQAAIAS